MRGRHPVRGGLRRTLFFAFGVTILATAGTAAGVFRCLGGTRGWDEHRARAERFAAGRFAVVWDDPAARRELGRSVARDLRIGVRLVDGDGHVLDRFAWPADCRANVEVPVRGEGTAAFCFDTYQSPIRPTTAIFAFLVPVAVLWTFAGMWARRLARPLRELTSVAKDLGDGKLERRARLRHGARGEVGELTRAINDMAGRIERQIKAERELLATVSHEMRTPLARVRVLLEIGREGGTRDVASEIEREVLEMDALVGNLLAGARLDFGTLSPTEIDPKDLAERALARATLPDASVEVVGDAGRLVGDASLLGRALAAMLENARTHGGGTIVLRVVRRGNRVAFEVDDEGPGLPEGDEARIFEPFAKGERSKGTGLGLAIVRRIAEAHRGRAYAERREKGARVGIEVGSLTPAA